MLLTEEGWVLHGGVQSNENPARLESCVCGIYEAHHKHLRQSEPVGVED